MRSALFFVRNLATRCAVDRAVAYALFGQGWSVLAGPISIWLIARFLTIEEQGYYYTFGSLLAVQLFFELGLTTLLVTFTAHEKARLSWVEGKLTGEPRALARLSSLLRISILWYAVLAVTFAGLVVPFGIFFFVRQSHAPFGTALLVPWVGMALATSLNLFIVPCVALLEGCGLIKETYLARLAQTIFGNAIFWLVLFLGGRLLAACLSSLGGWVAMAIWVGSYRQLFTSLWQHPAGDDRIDWWQEIWPLQWKLACSWISGYFIFQLFTPVLFAYHGPASAGRMGMSLNLVNRINAFSLTWISTKTPVFAALVANRNYLEMDKTFFRCSLASLTAAALMVGALWGLTLLLRVLGSPYADRLLDPSSLAFLGVGTIISVVAYCEATYMRAHKEEPLVFIWTAFSLVIGGSIYFFGRHYGALGMTVSYCVLMGLVCGAVATPYFLIRRRRWQAESPMPL